MTQYLPAIVIVIAGVVAVVSAVIAWRLKNSGARKVGAASREPGAIQSIMLSPPDGNLLMSITSNGVVTQEPVSLKSPVVTRHSSDELSDLARAQLKPVGICIYCGATENLCREHIIPFGLSGTAVLPAASCKRCAKITSAFELQILRGGMRDVRVFRKLRSRSKHADALHTQRLTIRRNGIEETVELPLHEYPILLHLLTFDLPGVLSGYDGTGIRMTGVATLRFGPRPQEIAKRLGAQELLLNSQPDHPVAFARMIGKIAYAMAIAQGALDVTEHRPEIVASLLGEVDEIGRWVGTLTGPFRKYSGGTLHRMTVLQDANNGRVMVEVQLFADSDAPTYVVVLR